MELRSDASLYSTLGNENSDAGCIKFLSWPQVPLCSRAGGCQTHLFYELVSKMFLSYDPFDRQPKILRSILVYGKIMQIHTIQVTIP